MRKYQAMLFTAYWDGNQYAEGDLIYQCNKRKNVSYRVIDCEEPYGVELSTKLQVRSLPYLILKKGDKVLFRGTFKRIDDVMRDILGSV